MFVCAISPSNIYTSLLYGKNDFCCLPQVGNCMTCLNAFVSVYMLTKPDSEATQWVILSFSECAANKGMKKVIHINKEYYGWSS